MAELDVGFWASLAGEVWGSNVFIELSQVTSVNTLTNGQTSNKHMVLQCVFHRFGQPKFA